MLIFTHLLVIFFILIFSIYLSGFERRYFLLFKVLHFLSGFVLASFFYLLFRTYTDVIWSVLLLGIIWELWEILVDYSSGLKRWLRLNLNYNVNSFSYLELTTDLVLDMTGAVVFLTSFS